MNTVRMEIKVDDQPLLIVEHEVDFASFDWVDQLANFKVDAVESINEISSTDFLGMASPLK